MKIAMLMLSALISLNAMARTPIKQTTEILRNVSINGQKTEYVAQLQLDYLDRTMKVEIYKDICGTFSEIQDPSIVRCLAMPMHVTTISAPMQRRYTSCGSTIYEGRKDQRPVDGLLTEMKVMDHSRRVCRDLVESPLIVDAKTTNPWSRETTEFHITK
ncbi:MAG: hypothetical protein M9962_05820 [Oligoflexia bacterium]|nr:hypothetical protein [Oligoflexia bacterium]